VEVKQMPAIVRFDPSRELDAFQSDFNRLIDGFFGGRANGSGGNGAQRWVPAIDLVETADSLVLKADLPGLTEDDVEIEVKDSVLTISGERSGKQEEKTENYHRIERSYGRFSRSLTLPEGVDPGSVKADFENGVLQVTVPKPAERKPHKISIGKRTVEGSGQEV
jgi:HSP20 family protein